jgi:hypothetical protein
MMASLISAKRWQFILIKMRVATTEAVGGAEDEPLTTQAKLVCQSTLMHGAGTWFEGRASNFAMEAATTASLHAFFEGLKAHACPCATRFVQTESGFELRDNHEEVMDFANELDKTCRFC